MRKSIPSKALTLVKSEESEVVQIRNKIVALRGKLESQLKSCRSRLQKINKAYQRAMPAEIILRESDLEIFRIAGIKIEPMWRAIGEPIESFLVDALENEADLRSLSKQHRARRNEIITALDKWHAAGPEIERRFNPQNIDADEVVEKYCEATGALAERARNATSCAMADILIKIEIAVLVSDRKDLQENFAEAHDPEEKILWSIVRDLIRLAPQPSPTSPAAFQATPSVRKTTMDAAA